MFDENKNKVDRFTWIFRSNPGAGKTNNKDSPDPAFGYCIKDLSSVYIQKYGDELRWYVPACAHLRTFLLVSSYKPLLLFLYLPHRLKTFNAEGVRVDSLLKTYNPGEVGDPFKWILRRERKFMKV